MGLGKTIQVIAFIAHLVATGNPGPHLVIATASTLVNWLQEFERFAPDILVEPYHGTLAERRETAERVLDDRQSVHVIVTTYEMATKKEDSIFLRKLKPDVSFVTVSTISVLREFVRYLFVTKVIFSRMV